MNKPAPKEPSMDEILSSIRQIIADDDAAGLPRRSSAQAAPAPMQPASAFARAYSAPAPIDLDDQFEDAEPLALSPAQIIEQRTEEAPSPFSFENMLAETPSARQDDAQDEEEAPLAAPEPVSFEPEEPEERPVATAVPLRVPGSDARPTPEPARAETVRVPEPPRPEAPSAQAAALPDPTLSSDFAEELLGPATKAAVRGSITKLNAIGLGNAGLTIESLMRDMLRPMLKEWLDENLPAVVERMVEREIARVSRGE
ncbi:DUF2497 domain-containing protein [Devosia sp. 1635]|uniref:PopZ family protein n=1 Tax=Devosia sp. 1635 TaxID=2726066 RepID=UPI0020BFA08B|nr:DUF2497 domain-containing protein [Devosia sp. 1635]